MNFCLSTSVVLYLLCFLDQVMVFLFTCANCVSLAVKFVFLTNRFAFKKLWKPFKCGETCGFLLSCVVFRPPTSHATSSSPLSRLSIPCPHPLPSSPMLFSLLLVFRGLRCIAHTIVSFHVKEACHHSPPHKGLVSLSIAPLMMSKREKEKMCWQYYARNWTAEII